MLCQKLQGSQNSFGKWLQCKCTEQLGPNPPYDTGQSEERSLQQILEPSPQDLQC